MGGRDAQAMEFLAAAYDGAGGANSETLYVELRQGTNPVNPAEWFTLTRE
jgi:septal ring factor EnvC (AmiA/AmiB activator)